MNHTNRENYQSFQSSQIFNTNQPFPMSQNQMINSHPVNGPPVFRPVVPAQQSLQYYVYAGPPFYSYTVPPIASAPSAQNIYYPNPPYQSSTSNVSQSTYRYPVPSTPVPPPNKIQFSSKKNNTEYPKPEVKSSVERRQSRAIPIINPNTRKIVTDDINLAKSISSSSTIANLSEEIKLVDESLKNDDTSEEEINEAQNHMLSNEDASITSIIKQIPKTLEQQLNLPKTNEPHTTIKTITIHSSKQETKSYVSHQYTNQRGQHHSSQSHRINYNKTFVPKKADKQISATPFNNKNNDLREEVDSNNNYQHKEVSTEPYELKRCNSFLEIGRTVDEETDPIFEKLSKETGFEEKFLVTNSNCGNQESFEEESKIETKISAEESKIEATLSIEESKTETTSFKKELEIKPKSYSKVYKKATVQQVSFENLSPNTRDTNVIIQCRKYSMVKLRDLQKSSLVLEKPPFGDNLLSAKLSEDVWRKLFDKYYRLSDEDETNDSFNTSYTHGKHHLLKKSSSGNIRYNEGHSNHRSKHTPDKGFIRINQNISEDVKLNEAEKAWKPSHFVRNEDVSDEESQMQDLVRNFRSLLNKITAENFNSLVGEVQNSRKYYIDTTSKLDRIVELLFEKSISEPGFASTYAKLCQAIIDVIKTMDHVNRKTTKPLKVSLIKRCQEEFDRCENDIFLFQDLQERINEAGEEEKEELIEFYYKIRQRANGTVKFIGELYKINMLTAKIMNDCITRLLHNNVIEESIERVCKLLTTIGKKLESELTLELMEKHFKILNDLAFKNTSLIKTSRIRFDIMNVIDLRKSNWIPRVNSRSNETNPKTLQQLEEEDKREKQRQQAQLQEYNDRPKNQHQYGRNNKYNNDNHGFTAHSKSSFDFKNIQFPQKHRSLETMSLGPPGNFFKNFHRQSQPTLTSSASTSNIFSNLATDCDDPELIVSQAGRSGFFSGKIYRKEYNINKQGSDKLLPKYQPLSPANENDKCLYTELTKDDEKYKYTFTDNIKAYQKGDLTLKMLMDNVRQIKFNKYILCGIYNDYLDKKVADRRDCLDIIIQMLQNNILKESINIEGLRLVLKMVPDILPDVPLAYEYIGEYFVQLIKTNLMSIQEVEKICDCDESKQKTLEYVKDTLLKSQVEKKPKEDSKMSPIINKMSLQKPSSEQNEETLAIENATSKNVEKSEEMKELMSKLEFFLKKKKKDLEAIYKIIEAKNSSKQPVFIQELTITILKTNYDAKGKKLTKLKTFSEVFPILVRYIDNNILLSMKCIDAIIQFTNTYKCEDKLNELFQLFYENEVISEDAFENWKANDEISKTKIEALKQTSVFFSNLEISQDFNCTSSTIKG